MTHPIYPYAPPRELAPGLWQVEGSLKIPVVKRNMTVFRTRTGELLLYSVVAMHDEGMQALEALGRPAIVVVPHDRHHMDLPFYKDRYPTIRVLAPVPTPVRGVRIDGPIEDLEAHGIRAYLLPGGNHHDVAMELPLDEGIALVVCETLVDTPDLGVVGGLLVKAFGPPHGGFGVARAVRFREIVDRDATSEWLSTLSARGDVRLVLTGHGPPVTHDVSQALAHASHSLYERMPASASEGANHEP